MSKNFMIILAIIVAILGGIAVFSGKKDNNNGSNGSATTSNHIIGQNKKGVTLLEYGDFQCPVCGAYYPVVKQVKEKYGDDIAIQFRHLPLTQIHPNAFAAARAAEAAAKQNKFWEMHDLLFEQQTAWSQSSAPYSVFEGYAKQLSLDTNKFKTDYQSTEVNDIINGDVAEFKKTGQQQSTPTFFVNGVYIENSKLSGGSGPTLEKFSEVIDAAIADQNKKQ